MKRRVLAFMLSLSMILTSVPMNAFAADVMPEASVVSESEETTEELTSTEQQEVESAPAETGEDENSETLMVPEKSDEAVETETSEQAEAAQQTASDEGPQVMEDESEVIPDEDSDLYFEPITVTCDDGEVRTLRVSKFALVGDTSFRVVPGANYLNYYQLDEGIQVQQLVNGEWTEYENLEDYTLSVENFTSSLDTDAKLTAGPTDDNAYVEVIGEFDAMQEESAEFDIVAAVNYYDYEYRSEPLRATAVLTFGTSEPYDYYYATISPDEQIFADEGDVLNVADLVQYVVVYHEYSNGNESWGDGLDPDSYTVTNASVMGYETYDADKWTLKDGSREFPVLIRNGIGLDDPTTIRLAVSLTVEGEEILCIAETSIASYDYNSPMVDLRNLYLQGETVYYTADTIDDTDFIPPISYSNNSEGGRQYILDPSCYDILEYCRVSEDEWGNVGYEPLAGIPKEEGHYVLYIHGKRDNWFMGSAYVSYYVVNAEDMTPDDRESGLYYDGDFFLQEAYNILPEDSVRLSREWHSPAEYVTPSGYLLEDVSYRVSDAYVDEEYNDLVDIGIIGDELSICPYGSRKTSIPVTVVLDVDAGLACYQVEFPTKVNIVHDGYTITSEEAYSGYLIPGLDKTQMPNNNISKLVLNATHYDRKNNTYVDTPLDGAAFQVLAYDGDIFDEEPEINAEGVLSASVNEEAGEGDTSIKVGACLDGTLVATREIMYYVTDEVYMIDGAGVDYEIQPDEILEFDFALKKVTKDGVITYPDESITWEMCIMEYDPWIEGEMLVIDDASRTIALSDNLRSGTEYNWGITIRARTPLLGDEEYYQAAFGLHASLPLDLSEADFAEPAVWYKEGETPGLPEVKVYSENAETYVPLNADEYSIAGYAMVNEEGTIQEWSMIPPAAEGCYALLLEGTGETSGQGIMYYEIAMIPRDISQLVLFTDDVIIRTDADLDYDLDVRYSPYDHETLFWSFEPGDYRILGYYPSGSDDTTAPLTEKPTATGSYEVRIQSLGGNSYFTSGQEATVNFRVEDRRNTTSTWKIRGEALYDGTTLAEAVDVYGYDPDLDDGSGDDAHDYISSVYYNIAGYYKATFVNGKLGKGEEVDPETNEPGYYYVIGEGKNGYTGTFDGVVHLCMDDADAIQTEVSITDLLEVNSQFKWLEKDKLAYCFTAPSDGEYTFSISSMQKMSVYLYGDAPEYEDALDYELYEIMKSKSVSRTLNLRADEVIHIVVSLSRNVVPGVEGVKYSLRVSKNGEHIHEYVKVEAKQSTCTEEGNREYWYCEGCDSYALDSTGTFPTTLEDIVLPKAEHSFTDRVSDKQDSPATCTEAAKYFVQCDNCDEVSNNFTVAAGEPQGHSYVNNRPGEMITEATCTEAAVHHVLCDRCDNVSDELTVSVGDPRGHSYVENRTGELITPATCTEAAVYHVLCDRCDNVSDDLTVSVGNPLGHNYETVRDNETDEGYDSVVRCDRENCGAELSRTHITNELEKKIVESIPESQLSEEAKEAILADENATIEVITAVDVLDEAPAAEQSKIETAMAARSEDAEVLYLDLTVTVTIETTEGGSETYTVAEPSAPITFTINVPASMLNEDGTPKGKLYIVVCHNDETYIIDNGTYNQADKTYTFDADKFSTYALTYETHQHSYNNKVLSGELASAATCTANARYYVKCDDAACNEINKSITAEKAGTKLAHAFGAYVTTKNPTVVAAGTKTRTCSRCGAKENAAIAKLPASISFNAANIVLKKKQSTTGLQVNLAAGDRLAGIVSSNLKVVKAVVTGANTCKITALKKTGKATLTFRTAAGAVKVITVKVQSGNVNPTKIYTNVPGNRLVLKVGQRFQIKATFDPFTCVQKPAFTTSKKKVATVGKKNGLVAAKKAGTTKITCKIGSKKANVTVVVTP